MSRHRDGCEATADEFDTTCDECIAIATGDYTGEVVRLRSLLVEARDALRAVAYRTVRGVPTDPLYGKDLRALLARLDAELGRE